MSGMAIGSERGTVTSLGGAPVAAGLRIKAANNGTTINNFLMGNA
jgi:hypothetical protein